MKEERVFILTQHSSRVYSLLCHDMCHMCMQPGNRHREYRMLSFFLHLNNPGVAHPVDGPSSLNVDKIRLASMQTR